MRDYDDEHTRVDGRRNAAPPPPPPLKKLPSFIPCETVVPVVTYRDQNQKLGAALASLEASVMERMPQATPVPAKLPAKTVRGALTVVFGCRGGSGATTLAINTAAQLVRTGRTVCLVDLDLHLGDLFVALDLEAQTSLAAVAREAGSLDAASLRRRVAQHASGVCALTQAGHVDDLDSSLPSHLPALLDALRAHFDHVIVDGVRDFNDAALPALEAATSVLVVVTQDVPSVRRAARALGILRRLGVDDTRCRLVVNRAVRGAAIDDVAIERALSLKVAARVREDGRVAKALDDGVLLLDVARTRKITTDIAGVAALIGGR
jgi:pilus assembly protein CpaE